MKILTNKYKRLAKVCEECGCTRETFTRNQYMLCPWCDEELIVGIASDALKRNAMLISTGQMKVGKK